MSTPSKVSFTVRRPTPLSRPPSSGPESDGQFKIPALPRHMRGERSATGSPLAGSREGSDDDDTGIVFSNGAVHKGDAREPDSSDDDDTKVQEELVTEFDQFSVQRCVHFIHHLATRLSSLKSLHMDDLISTPFLCTIPVIRRGKHPNHH